MYPNVQGCARACQDSRRVISSYLRTYACHLKYSLLQDWNHDECEDFSTVDVFFSFGQIWQTSDNLQKIIPRGERNRVLMNAGLWQLMFSITSSVICECTAFPEACCMIQ